MRTYSPFFETLHDETEPVGHLGRGTHYSILRAIVFRGPQGAPTTTGSYLDFAIIWDEDHDDRIIEPIFKLYCEGNLWPFVAFGERKGMMNGVVKNKLRLPTEHENLSKQLRLHCETMSNGDYWTTELSDLNDTMGLIAADESHTRLYLSNIDMLWGLGLKTIKHPLSEFEQAAERDRMIAENFPSAVVNSMKRT